MYGFQHFTVNRIMITLAAIDSMTKKTMNTLTTMAATLGPLELSFLYEPAGVNVSSYVNHEKKRTRSVIIV